MKPYYDDGNGVTIYNADCREVREWLAADVIVTDPPYGIAWRRGVNNARNSKSHSGIRGDKDTSARDEMLALTDGKPCVVFGSFYAPYPSAIRQVLVWHKPPDAGVVGSTTGYRRDAEPIFLVGKWPIRRVQWSSVLTSEKRSIAGVVTATGHPHTKPTDLVMRLVDLIDGVVADPFMGSGTTLLAAKQLPLEVGA